MKFGKQGQKSSRDGYPWVSFCHDYLQKNIAIVSVESPTGTVTKSKKVQTTTFTQQLATIGGTLGLFTGMSLLSLIEIVCFCFNITKRSCSSAKKCLCKDRKPSEGEEEEKIPKEVREYVSKMIKKATSSQSHQNKERAICSP